MTPEKPLPQQPPAKPERRVWPGGPTKAKLDEMLEQNRRVGERAHQPKLIETEVICGDCGNPMSNCQCADQGVGHHPGRVPR